MAPEQAACNSLSPASDWYAVGVMLYEILTGYFPINGKPLDILYRKQTDTPKAPRELEPEVPPELNDLCVALLDRNQENRPTAEEILRCIGAEELIETLTASTWAGSDKKFELESTQDFAESLGGVHVARLEE
jgi:serine/threonine protein kinase